MRTLAQIIPSVATSDGAGVKLRRSLGSQRGLQVDPFLMLDEFYSDDPKDYIAGFRGDLSPGDVQWMTAARGIIHSEMPQQSEGRMRGFQLWINLPSKEKMKPAHYRDIPAQQIPSLQLASGASAKVIAGSVVLEGASVSGPVNGPDAPLSTDPLYLDLKLPAGVELTVPVSRGHNAFLYVYEGEAKVGEPQGARTLPYRAAGVLSDGDAVQVQGGERGAQLLLLAARPLREPVVQYGPFVMNTRQEIEQAVEDYRSGRFAA
jgi:quercetin 2,3-dioxygenase